MDPDDLRAWFGEYLGVFAACGRGELEVARLLHYYGVPLLVTTDDAALALTTEEEVVRALRPQIEGMRAAAYDHSDTLSSEMIPINEKSALHTAEFARRRADGSEIGRLRATYLITDGPNGRRISVLAVRGS